MKKRNLSEAIALTNNHSFSILLFLLMFTLVMHLKSQNIQEIKKYKKESGAEKNNELQHYISDLHTTVYLENNNTKIYGEGNAKYLKCDAASISKLNEQNNNYNQIEFIEIKLSKNGDELKANLSKTDFSNYPNLKYVLIRSTYELNEKQFENILSGAKKNNVIFLYEISIPE